MCGCGCGCVWLRDYGRCLTRPWLWFGAQIEDEDEDEDMLAKAEEPPELAVYKTHPPAGQGDKWRPKGSKRREVGALRATKPDLPEGFLEAIYERHIGAQYVDYLPYVPNLNQARGLGSVMPRQIMEDWVAKGYDPWSYGREPRIAQFIPDLSTLESDMGDGRMDSSAAADVQARKAAENAAKESKDLEMLFSWCRHGKYAEIEEFIQSPDNTLHIDTRDAAGNTLLLVSAQNGNKRIAKLCMRRGADINAQNVRWCGGGGGGRWGFGCVAGCGRGLTTVLCSSTGKRYCTTHTATASRSWQSISWRRERTTP